MRSEPSERTVSLVIPAYNEEARIGNLVATLTGSATEDLARAGLHYLEAVIVDDGSTDGTAGLLSAASREDERIRPVLSHAVNRGKGAAVRSGVMAALGEVVLLVDVDLSTPLSDACKLTRALPRPGRAIAIGSRDLDGAEVEAPLLRRVLGAGFNLAVRALTGLDLADTQCGFKLLETAVARELLDDQLSPGFAFDVELLLRARLSGLTIVEIPVGYIHDERSKVRVLRASTQMARELVRISVQLRRGDRRGRSTLPAEGSGRH